MKAILTLHIIGGPDAEHTLYIKHEADAKTEVMACCAKICKEGGRVRETTWLAPAAIQGITWVFENE